MVQPPSSREGRPTLQGVRILDLTRVLAGPFATYLLAQLGADVVKVEPPAGDASRSIPPFIDGESTYYLSINSGKRGVSVDLRSEEGRGLILELAGKSDAVLHNFRPETASVLGLTFDRLRRVNPRVVLCSISGFGASGSMSGRVAYDVTLQAMTGLMAVTGHPGAAPARPGVPVADLVAGMNAALGIVAALGATARDGLARQVEAPLFDGALSLLTYVAGAALATGEDPGPVGSGHYALVPYRAYEALDGWVVIAVLADKFWVPMCRAVGLDQLADDPGLRTNEARLLRRSDVDEAIAGRVRVMSREEVLSLLEAADVPCAPVNSVLEALHEPLVDERGLLRTFHHPRAGTYRGLGPPISISPGASAGERRAPLLGEHTREVLSSILGYGDGDIARMETSGVIVCGEARDDAAN